MGSTKVNAFIKWCRWPSAKCEDLNLKILISEREKAIMLPEVLSRRVLKCVTCYKGWRFHWHCRNLPWCHARERMKGKGHESLIGANKKHDIIVEQGDIWGCWSASTGVPLLLKRPCCRNVPWSWQWGKRNKGGGVATAFAQQASVGEGASACRCTLWWGNGHTEECTTQGPTRGTPAQHTACDQSRWSDVCSDCTACSHTVPFHFHNPVMWVDNWSL